MTYICKFCTKAYVPKHSERKTYCSRECSFADKAARARPPFCPITFANCRVCRNQFIKRYRNLTCSQACKQEIARRAATIHFMASHGPKTRQSPRAFTCRECGKQASVGYGNKLRVFCSHKCREVNGERIQRSAHHAKRRGVTITEYFDPFIVFERDGWICQLCGCGTPLSQRGTRAPNAPELDHILAIADGGQHTQENTQLLCRHCNREKARNEGARHQAA